MGGGGGAGVAWVGDHSWFLMTYIPLLVWQSWEPLPLHYPTSSTAILECGCRVHGFIGAWHRENSDREADRQTNRGTVSSRKLKFNYVKKLREQFIVLDHRLKMEVDLQSLFGLHVTWCAQLFSLAEETLQLPPSPRIWTRITRALLVSKDRRHLFVTPCSWPIDTFVVYAPNVLQQPPRSLDRKGSEAADSPGRRRGLQIERKFARAGRRKVLFLWLLTLDPKVSAKSRGVKDLYPIENNCKIILVPIKP